MKLLMITRKVDRNDSLAGFTYTWVKAFAELVAELHVICLEKGDTTGLPENCNIYSLGKELKKDRWSEFVLFHRYAKRIVPNVDAIFSHQNPEYGILIAPWAKAYKKKLIAWYTHRAVTWRLRLMTALCTTVVTASKESFRLPTKKLKVLSHGIDTDHFVSVPQSSSTAKRLLSVSRLSPSKHIEMMISLLPALSEHMKEKIQLRIVATPARPGDHAYAEKLRKQVSDMKLEQYVQFITSVPYTDLPQEYAQADLFLNFSDTGSLDKAVLEALSCGIPVLTTNIAFKEICEQLDPRMFTENSAEQIGAHAKDLLVNHSVRPELLRQYVIDEHSLHHLIKKILALYV